MKQAITFLLLGFFLNSSAQTEGYEISITLKPFANQYVYLGHHYGAQKPIIDSVLLDNESKAVFSGNKPLPQGIYLVGYPGKTGYFEILVGQRQHFSVFADTTRNNHISFGMSPDNELFRNYQLFIGEKGRILDEAYKGRQNATTDDEKKKWTAAIEQTNSEIQDYRNGLMKEHPEAFITFLFKAMKEPEVPPASMHPNGVYDSLFAFNYYKKHFWDGVEFWDERLARTPFFESRVEKYFSQLVYPNADSVIKEIDYMLAFASANEEMQKFLLLKFINRYLNQKYMWEDKVFVHLFEKYISQKQYSWLTEQGRKTITDRAYSLMANILGNPAPDILLPDPSDKNSALYSVDAKYTLVVIWDPTCGHCKEVLPKIDSLYNTRWKNYGLKIFALAKETDGTHDDWINFITNHNIDDWHHVYNSKAADKARTNSGVPGYSQLYDVLSFPTLYLLDKDKRIIAKKLTFEQIDDFLLHKEKQQ